MPFSLYIHIPWCESKCPYCDFNSHAAAQWPEADYVGALENELTRRAADRPWLGESIKTIFFGGGTPSLFKPESIATLIDAADRLCGIERGAEITLEANPGTVDADKLRGLRSAGVNRISFGAQSFDAAILKFLGRIHTAGQTRAAAEMAHRAGFERLNLDLIFAAPGQTLEGVRRDIERAAALGPDHISAYNLTFEEGTPFFAEMKRGRITPQGDEAQAQMYAMIRAELPVRGYRMYEISNYAAPGHESRHNLAYWQAESYLGLGAGAHSFAHAEADSSTSPAPADDSAGASRERSGSGLRQQAAPRVRVPEGGRRWWNERNPARYISAAARDGVAEAGAEIVDRRTAAGEFVFLNLRLRDGFALSDFSTRLGYDFDRLFGAQTAQLFESGLLLRENGRIRLSERGLELADSIFAEFV